jgi:hypothetical protein
VIFVRRGDPNVEPQPILANLLNLENLESDYKDSVVACDKYISPVDVLKERFHDPNM